jgi:hypothetical protein
MFTVQEPTPPHDHRLVRVIQRIVVERSRGMRTHPVTGEICLTASQQLFYELFLNRRPSWLSFLRDWARVLGCPFRIEYADDASPEWWIRRSDNPIPWYNESDYIDDLFAILDANMEWDAEQAEMRTDAYADACTNDDVFIVDEELY